MKIGEHAFEGTTAEALGYLEGMHAGDKTAERKRKRSGCSSGLAFVVGIILTIAGSANEFGVMTAIGWVLIISAVALLFLYFYFVRRDLDDRKVEAARRFLSIASADFPRDAPVSIRLDFRDYRKGGDLLSKEGGALSERRMKYAHDWLEITGKLADGTSLRIRAGDRIGRKEKPKRKYTKVKESIVGQLQIQLKLGAKRYAQLGDVAAALARTRPPRPLVVGRVAQDGQRVSVTLATHPSGTMQNRYGLSKTDEEHLLTGDVLLQALVWVYAGVGAVRGAA